MQYFKPDGETIFAGDCMPFFHDGVFHLFYLRDENHHGTLGGLGGHQWAHASSPDLIHWTHHPLAIGITADWEGSICTGSTFFHQGTYYGFYATRKRDWTQHLCVATSTDGVNFQKSASNPFASPPRGYDPLHYRDPFVFRDDLTGLFHMLVTATLTDYPLHDLGGCLAHLTSPDLHHWEVKDPFLIPGLPGAPECPDYFYWNGWYYLIFSNGLVARYRMSREPFGPWIRPKVDTLDSAASRVMKTAAFTGNRRIGVAWVGTREGDRDTGSYQWGGHIVFREIFQNADGTLSTGLPREMVPSTGNLLAISSKALTPHVRIDSQRVALDARQGLEVATFTGVSTDARVTMKITPGANAAAFGLRLRGSEHFQGGYDLRFNPCEQSATLADQTITGVEGLDQPFALEIVLKADLIDVCIDKRRCLIGRYPEQNGDNLSLYAHCAEVTFESLAIAPIVLHHNG